MEREADMAAKKRRQSAGSIVCRQASIASEEGDKHGEEN